MMFETAAAGAPGTLKAGKNCWRIVRATKASVIVDAEDYFDSARSAMLKAERRIMLIGWDFDARIRLGESPDSPDAPEKLGAFILWLVKRRPDLEVYLLRWDVGSLKLLVRGTTIFTLLRWMANRRIHTKLDGSHPTGSSHHQRLSSSSRFKTMPSGERAKSIVYVTNGTGKWANNSARSELEARLFGFALAKLTEVALAVPRSELRS